jgi:Bacterial SH3 domain
MSQVTVVVIRFGLIVAALATPVVHLGTPGSWQHGRLMAEPQSSAEKQAFDAAKDLGTVEAWDAFLSNYSSGFHADLARAYVKKLGQEPAVQAPSPQSAPSFVDPVPNTYPAAAGSWGGVVRDGPGQNYRKVDSLQEGDPVTLLGPADVVENGYPWFRITYPGGGSGYQWGGILCSTGAERPDLFKTCTTGAQRQDRDASLPQRCRDNGGEWDGDQCRPKGNGDKLKKKAADKKRTCGSGQFYDNQKGRCMSYESQEDGPGELNDPLPKQNNSGMSCKQLKALCSQSDRNDDCDVYLNSCSGKGDN